MGDPMRLKLIRYAGPDYFPPSIISFYEFLRQSSRQSVNIWAFVVDFLREVLVEEGAAAWKVRFEELAERHLLNVSVRPDLWQLLYGVYSLKLEDGKDPRGRFLEYVVYRTVPYVAERPGKSEYECALHQELGQGRTRPIVESDATFDAGFLNDVAFEGHECKVNIWNFLSRAGKLSQPAQRKLGFMEAVTLAVEASGRECNLFLVSLLHRPTVVRALLRDSGFQYVTVLSPDDIEKRLVA